MTFISPFPWVPDALGISGSSTILICREALLVQDWHRTDETGRRDNAKDLASILMDCTTTSRSLQGLQGRVLTYMCLEDTRTNPYADSCYNEPSKPIRRRACRVVDDDDDDQITAPPGDETARACSNAAPIENATQALKAVIAHMQAQLNDLHAQVASLESDNFRLNYYHHTDADMLLQAHTQHQVSKQTIASLTDKIKRLEAQADAYKLRAQMRAKQVFALAQMQFDDCGDMEDKSCVGPESDMDDSGFCGED